MTTKARQLEAQRATVAYHVALTRIGAGTVAEALSIWQTYPATAKSNQSKRWLRDMTVMVMQRRSVAVTLGRVYYRLVRALVTGATVNDTESPGEKITTLGKLRTDFATVVGSQGVDVANPTATTRGASQRPQRPAQDDDDRILVEEIKRLKALEDAADRAAEQELQTALQALGPDNLEKLVSAVDEELPASVVDKARADAHKAAGARQAAAAERVSMNGARSTTWAYQENDERAIGWARVSRTGTPCGWCAMLISRGAVYRSRRAATVDYEEGDLYHDNCHCYAVPIFSAEQFANDPTFDLNREYAALWPRVTQGLGGKDALSAWRRFIREQNKPTKRKAA